MSGSAGDGGVSPASLQAGLVRRLRHLFQHADGRAILVPMDHGLYSGPVRGIEVPLHIARRVIPAADGLLVSPGFARAIAAELPARCALALRAGALSDQSPLRDREAVFLSVERALRCAADLVVQTLYIGGGQDAEQIRDAGAMVDAADRYGLPVMLEFLPRDDGWTPEQVAAWARLGAELGASAVKTIYTGDRESFARVTGGCPVPILIAGGPAVGTLADLLETVAGAVEAGAAGLAIGRRVWQHEEPARLLGWLGEIVHGRAGVEEILGRDRPARGSGPAS